MEKNKVMEHISNEQKANEIANAFFIENVSVENEQVIREMLNKAALEAMQWKDEQFAQEKQLWIDKAVDFISKRFYIGINNHVISKEEYYTLTELIRDIEQAMKGK